MIGTGKTAIMKNLNNHEEVAKIFDMVMWIKVSAGESKENLDMSQLQNVIAKRLKVDMASTSDCDDIADKISNELKGKRYLLLLDDVKADLDIHQMGIPPYCLLECWEAEDFLGNGGDSRKAYINGIHILNSLKDKSLLEEDESQKYVMMHKCIRQELPSSFGKLEHLEVLDIRGSGFNNIPSYIGNLNGLRHFRVSFAKCEDEVVDVIEVETPTIDLRINVPEANILYTFIEETRSWRNIGHIRSFQFFIDCPDSKYPCIPTFYECKRYVRYCNGEGINHPIFEVLANVDAFDLVNKKDIKQLSDLGIPSMKEVKGQRATSAILHLQILDYTTMVFMSWSNELFERSCS
ncbi:putative disease resistance protein [Camellia lanceoleosa]|uniref:Disease resistance protein n=1 Tax=Camellia lanceoleosa TaxID=1840588 RepID=A0ACC0INY6_9ERIC|nr:putative disease resistance protein [Camellia lanceoleosa]